VADITKRLESKAKKRKTPARKIPRRRWVQNTNLVLLISCVSFG